MGLRARIKAKIKEKIKDARSLMAIVHEEANHPGRPQPHMAARNPLWGGETGGKSDERSASQKNQEAQPTVQKSTPKPKKELDEDNDFWYLRGDDEGWSDPNPGQS